MTDAEVITFADVQDVFTALYLNCYAGEFSAEGMELTDASDEIVGALSVHVPPPQCIEPGFRRRTNCGWSPEGRGAEFGGDPVRCRSTAPLPNE
ncbi:MAG: hypothetical protein ACJARS_002853 [bacterium]